MPGLWLLQQSIEGLTTYFEIADRDGERSLVSNLGDVLDSVARTGRPTVLPHLLITDETFDLDFFEDGLTFASTRLLAAMSLPAEVAKIGEVDVTGSTGRVQEKGYRTLTLLLHGDALDHDESEGSVMEWVDGEGRARSEWMLAAPQPNRPAPRARWRTGFQPPADIFLVKGAGWRAATEGLARRVMASGATGVNFVYPIASAATGGLVSRIR